MSFTVPSLHFENAAGQLLEHPAGYALFTYKPGPRTLADLQALITRTGQLLRRKGWRRVLGDQRRMAPLVPEQSAWLVEYWQTYTQQHPGRIYAAVLLAQDVFARLAASQLKQEIRGVDMIYRQFANEHEAGAWLGQVA